MTKRQTMADPNSCHNRAADDEPIFTLLARDESAPYAINVWMADRMARGKNKAGDEQMRLAAADVQEFMDWRRANRPKGSPVADELRVLRALPLNALDKEIGSSFESTRHTGYQVDAAILFWLIERHGASKVREAVHQLREDPRNTSHTRNECEDSMKPTMGCKVLYTRMDGSIVTGIVTLVEGETVHLTYSAPGTLCVYPATCTEEGAKPGQWAWPPKQVGNFDASKDGGCDECGAERGDWHGVNCSRGVRPHNTWKTSHPRA